MDKYLNTAFISVIPKPEKDGSKVGNYRPISLINNDIKIMTKILETKMSSFIAKYLHKDLVGFIPGRQGLDQVRVSHIYNFTIKLTMGQRGPTRRLSGLH